MDVGVPPVLALVYRFRKAAMLTLHNFSDAAQTIHLAATLAASAWWTCSARSTARPPAAAARDRTRRLRLPLVPSARSTRR